MSSQIDVVIITATEDEFKVVHSAEADWKRIQDSDGYHYFVREEIGATGNKFNIALTQQVHMGSEDAAVVATKLSSKLSPLCLAMVGKCAGREGKVNLGDVIVGEKVFYFDIGKIIGDPKSKEDSLSLLPDLRNYNLRPPWIQNAQRMSDDWIDKIKATKPNRSNKTRVRVGPIATGKQVLKINADIFSDLEKIDRKILAIDMEAASIGLVAEYERKDFIVVKSVTDYGNINKNDEFGTYAVEASYRFLIEFLKENCPQRGELKIMDSDFISDTTGIKLRVDRILTGAKFNTKYYGYRNGEIVLPNTEGGLLSFSLWNDMRIDKGAFTNYFNTNIAGKIIRIPNYTTRHQIIEQYSEFLGIWGAAGIYRVTIAIPPGFASLPFNNEGSESGIEISNLEFIPKYTEIEGGYRIEEQRSVGNPVILVDRILTGGATNRIYFGCTSGRIYLPHLKGGFLSFKFWNDQRISNQYTINTINLSIDKEIKKFSQYTTPLDLKEYYAEIPLEWGPGGGSDIFIQIPAGLASIAFDNDSSQTGIEISDVKFTEFVPTDIEYRESVNRSNKVLCSFNRILHGATSGKVFYGSSKGHVVLPNDKGGTLSFLIWNDHHISMPEVNNTINITLETKIERKKLKTVQQNRQEFYLEPNLYQIWGPAGGEEINLKILPGIFLVKIDNDGSQTGIELSDFNFS